MLFLIITITSVGAPVSQYSLWEGPPPVPEYDGELWPEPDEA